MILVQNMPDLATKRRERIPIRRTTLMTDLLSSLVPISLVHSDGILISQS